MSRTDFHKNLQEMLTIAQGDLGVYIHGRIHQRSQVLDKSQLRFRSNLKTGFEFGPIKIDVAFC